VMCKSGVVKPLNISNNMGASALEKTENKKLSTYED